MKMICLVVMLAASAVAQEDYRAKAETCRQLAEDRNLTTDEREVAALLAAKCERLAAAQAAREAAEKRKEADELAACTKELIDLGTAYREGRMTKAEFDRRSNEILRKVTAEGEEAYKDFMRRHPSPPQQRAVGSVLTLHLKDGRRVTGRFISETTERIILAVGDKYVAVPISTLNFIEQNSTTPPPRQSDRRDREAPMRR